VIGLLIVMLAGVVSIYIGRQHVVKQQNSIAKSIHFQQEHIQRNVKFFDKDMGLLLYYLRFCYINNATGLNGLSIGQRDVNNSIQNVTIRNLESQKYDTDLFNPSNLLAGNLDFGFVLIFLFPLLIIAVTYNLLSEEKEGGTWKLISVQSDKPLKVLLQKFYVRAIVIYAMLIVLLAVAWGVLSIPFKAAFAAAAALAVVYLAFWFVACFWVVSWQRNSSTNAVSLLTIWVLLTIILPASINNYIVNKYPVPEAVATAVEQREGVHEKWDMEKQATMDKFYNHYPQFKSYRLPDKQFSWLWYYAMQQMGDDEALQHANQMKEKLWMRNNASNNIALFIPTLHTQLQLNELSQSGLGNQLKFLNGTEKFHEKMRLYFYPKIFSEAPVKDEDWSKFKAEYFNETVPMNWLRMYLPLVIITCALGFWSRWNFEKGSGYRRSF
jgi:ABC-2 type transport system permease protein